MPRTWPDKFRDAFRGLGFALASERSFWVHLPAAVAVGTMAAWLQVSRTEGLILGLCVMAVLVSELVNTAIEHLARAVSREDCPEVRWALDIASAAVLVAALSSAVIGGVIFVPRILAILQGV